MDFLEIITEPMYRGIRSRQERSAYVAMMACKHCGVKNYMKKLQASFRCAHCAKDNAKAPP